ncbi:MAG: methyl-accepting chemotaxis protein [Lachnospiraceae bacterium]|nr:methyl-accepting chemotaxis protein [Lachnospiraceae bacterium]
MKKKGGLGLLPVLLTLGLAPLIVSALIIGILSAKELSANMEDDVFNELRVAAEGLRQYYEYDLMNGDELTYDEDHQYVDSLKGDGVELTLFQGDTRFMTSLRKDDGQRNEGSQAAADIWASVKAGNEYHSDGVNIGGKDYYVYYVPLRDASGQVVGMAFSGEAEAKVKSAINKVVRLVIIIAVIIVAACAALVILVASRIKKPIGLVAEATGHMAKGDLTKPLEAESFINEVNSVIDSVQSLQSNMTEVIGRVSTGAGNINSAMGEVSEATDTCNSAADGITGAITELSKGSMEMAESVQNIAGNMTEMGESIDEVAELAVTTSEVVTAAKDVSVQAKNKLEDLMSANAKTVEISDDVARGITESNEAVENIRTAAETIASIASQTNLLALNASIEAARAGEAGKGFAVVADNIKNLAAQSDESAGEIQTVIADIIAKSARNVSLAEQIKEAVSNEGTVLTDVGDGFEQVERSIEQSTDAMRQVTDKVEAINRVKDRVLDEISTLSSISEENAASTQETNASMQEMAANIAMIQNETSSTKSRSDELQSAVEFFQI